jgi:sulfur carrier protein
MMIDIYYSLTERHTERLSVDVAPGARLIDVLPESVAALMDEHRLTCAVWGRAVPQDYVLQADDRIELVRPLRVDPMTARRERFKQQGVKKAGLFKSKRQGAKAGY